MRAFLEGSQLAEALLVQNLARLLVAKRIDASPLARGQNAQRALGEARREG